MPRIPLHPPTTGDRPHRLARLFGGAPAAARAPDGVRVYVIGDVHGRSDLLDRLVEQVRADALIDAAADTHVVLLGDLIDRGPDSAGVVRRAMTGLDWATLTVLRGNHEQAMLDGLAGDVAMLTLWLTHGGDAALASWGVPAAECDRDRPERTAAIARAAIPVATRDWIAARPLSIGLGDYHFVHAGIRPGVPINRQSPEDALWIRRDFLDSTRDHGVVVVHGHTITSTVDQRLNRIGIDTGAVQSGRLTALALDGTRRWTLTT